MKHNREQMPKGMKCALVMTGDGDRFEARVEELFRSATEARDNAWRVIDENLLEAPGDDDRTRWPESFTPMYQGAWRRVFPEERVAIEAAWGIVDAVRLLDSQDRRRIVSEARERAIRDVESGITAWLRTLVR